MMTAAQLECLVVIGDMPDGDPVTVPMIRAAAGYCGISTAYQHLTSLLERGMVLTTIERPITVTLTEEGERAYKAAKSREILSSNSKHIQASEHRHW